MSDEPSFRLPPVDPDAARAVPATSLSPELLASLLADGDDELAAWTFRHALEEASRADVYDGLLRDAMALVGERWKTGQWSVAEEHLASRTVLRTLERIAPRLGPESRVGPLAVLAGVAGEQHMIGLVCLEHVLAEIGWTVVNMGADLPPADLGSFVGRNEVAMVALSALNPDRLSSLAESVRAVREATPGRRVPVLIGGQIGARPGISEAVDADGAASSLAAALTFAEAHQPPAVNEGGRPA